jgi:hypothetical protein
LRTSAPVLVSALVLVDVLHTYAVAAVSEIRVLLPILVPMPLFDLSACHEVHVKKPAQPQLLIEYPTEDASKVVSEVKVSSYVVHIPPARCWPG